MREYLTDNPVMGIMFIVAVIAVAIFLLIKLIQVIGMEKVRAYVYQLFVEAENEFMYGANKEKFEYVVNLAKAAIPAPFNLFITEGLLRKTVQLWFDICKDLLDDGRFNGPPDEE